MLKTKEGEHSSIKYLKQYCKEVHSFPIPSDNNFFVLFKLILGNLFSPLPFTAQKYYTNEMVNKIKVIISKSNIDIVHFDTLILAQFKNIIPRTIPWVLVNHNVESILIRRRALKEKSILKILYIYIQYLKLKKYERTNCPKAHANVVVSQKDKEDLEIIAQNSRYYVVENGVDTAYFNKQGINKKKDILIMVGGWSWLPNYDSFKLFYHKIYPLIKKDIPNTILWIVGANPTQDMLDIEKKDASVKIYGLVDDVRPLYEQASVFLVPLRIGGGTRLKILDALSMEKSIVTTSIGCEGILVEDRVHLFIADTPEDFAQKTITLLKDEQLNERLGKNGRKLMLEKYDWTLIGPKMEAVYKYATRP